MKKIYAFFALPFLLLSASFSFADKRHDIIIENYKETHPEDRNGFYTLNNINLNEDLKNAYLVLTAQELINNKNRIEKLLEKAPDLRLILNVEEGDGLVIDGWLSLGKDLALHARKLIIMNLTQDVSAIADCFLLNCRKLTQLDLSSLSYVKQIGNHFLSNCYELTHLELFDLDQITQVGNHFFFNCSGLSQLDLSSLNKIIKIGDFFLSGCKTLTELDISFLSQVTQIGDSFLGDCKGLTQLNISPLNHITQIGNSFLERCTGLVFLNLLFFNQITQIGTHFLSGCTGLTQLDLSSLSRVEKIGNHFLLCCGNFIKFEQITLPIYNSILKAALQNRFPCDKEDIGNMIQDAYIEGYVPVSGNTKSARH